MGENPPDSFAELWEHLNALRTVLLRSLSIICCGMVLAFFFHRDIVDTFTSSFRSFHTGLGGLALFSPLEGLAVALKVSFWVGFAMTSPLWMLSLAQFVIPALHRHERQLFFPFIALSLLFMAVGIFFGYWITLPAATRVLLDYNMTLGVNVWSLALYLDFTLFLLLANGIAFELGFALLFFVHFRIFSPEGMVEKRRWAMLTAFILAALLTPPDVLTQFLLAVPLIIFYEIAILYARARARR